MYDVVVIGAGPAGTSAAIQLKRSGIEPLLLEKDEAGGLLLNANLVENYPGFPDGVSGEILAETFSKHLKNAGVALRKEAVKKIFREKNVFHIVTNKDEVLAKCVILATGTLPKKLGIPDEMDIAGRKLFYEIKDLPANTDTFMVIGGGDIAFDYALNLSKTAGKIDIIIRGAIPKCIPVLSEKAERKANIKIHYRTIPFSMKEEKNIVVKCNAEGKQKNFVSDYVLVAVGRIPNIEMLEGALKDGLVAVSRTSNIGRINDELKDCSVPGLFLAGDVKNEDFRQTGISVGDGLMSAMKAVRFLRGKHEDYG
ncbi:MAG: NAD(P)/FAD-dependent oxidoreductase [Thermoplasmatales archaeon]|nr:NAD(P)/FAD-dependent oxidoreductase [Thermoplasmatales archaeon]